MSERVTTFVIKDDITNFFLLYKKLVNTSFDSIGIYTVYNSEQYKNLLNQDLVKLFPKMVYIGPTAMYEHYVELANFPHFSDLEKYNKNMINMDIVNHLMGYHLDEVFPAQKTAFRHNLHIDQEPFREGTTCIFEENYNLGLNLLDARYDLDGVIFPELPLILKEVNKQDKPIHIYVYGVLQQTDQIAYMNMLDEYIGNYTIINCMGMPYSQQIGTLLKLNLLVSGSYSWGALAYTMNIPSIVVYPYYLTDMKGHITPLNDTEQGNLYVELADEEVSIVIEDTMKGFI